MNLQPQVSAPPVVRPIARVPGAYFVIQPGRPLTINWPNGIWMVAKCPPVTVPTKEGV